MKKQILFILIITTVKVFPQNNVDVYNLNFGELSKLKIVTASKTEQDIGEVPTSIRVITASEISDKGYFTFDEMLSDLPGFQFRNIMSLNSYVFQRGIPNQNNLTLVLIDGVQLNELNSGGFYGGGQYNLANIERVEVVYGPSSVAYGTNAVSGIINIITKKAVKNQGDISTLVGSFNTLKSDASFNYVNEKKAFCTSVSGMVKRSDKANLKGDAGDNNWTDLLDNYENDYSLGIKLKLKGFTLGANLLQKQTSTATFQKTVGTGYRDYGTSWNIRFLNNFLKYEKTFSDKLKLSTILYNRNTTVLKNSIYYVVDTAQIGYYRPNNLTGLESVLNYNSQKLFSVTGGLVLEYEQLANGPSQTYSNSSLVKPPTPDNPPMHKNFLASVFIEPRLMLFKSLFLSGGLRFDQSTVYNQVLTPRAGLRYNLHKHSFRVSYAEAFRAPKPWDYTDGVGNPDLLPEKMRSLEASVSFSLLKNLKLDLTGYRNKLLNGIAKEFSGDKYKWINSSELITKGAELYVSYSTRQVESVINYTFTHSEDENGKHIAEISDHCANASLTYSLNQNWKINLRANYVGERENPKLISAINSKVIDPALILHGTLTWIPIEGLTVQLIGKNLLNTEYYHTSNRVPDRYRQPQRAVLLSVGYSFNK
jgi:outer membrane cobalamin receptor